MSREYIANTLKRLREATGLKADEVGAMIGKSGKTVNAWENGRGQPDAEILIKLCSIYKVSNILEEFDDKNIITKQSSFSSDEITHIKKYRSLDPYGKEAVTTLLDIEYTRCLEAKQKKIQHTRLIDFIDIPVSAGIGTYLDDEQREQKTVIDSDLADRADFILRIDGDSMEPKYHSGEYVFVKKQDAVDLGQICIYYVDGKGYMKKYGGDRLISLNSKYDDIFFSDHDIDEISCFGLVLGEAEVVE